MERMKLLKKINTTVRVNRNWCQFLLTRRDNLILILILHNNNIIVDLHLRICVHNLGLIKIVHEEEKKKQKKDLVVIVVQVQHQLLHPPPYHQAEVIIHITDQTNDQEIPRLLLHLFLIIILEEEIEAEMEEHQNISRIFKQFYLIYYYMQENFF